MEPLKKLKKLKFKWLTDYEYLGFMLDVQYLIETATLGKLGLEGKACAQYKENLAKEYAAFKNNLQHLNCLTNVLMSSEETTLLAELDARCRGIFNIINRSMNACRTWPKPPYESIPDKHAYLREAGKRLWRLHKHYIKTRQLPCMMKIKRMEEYVYHMEEKALSPHVNTLHLSYSLGKLRAANIEYKRAVEICCDKRVEKMFDMCTIYRRKVNKAYVELHRLIMATTIAAPTPETNAFADQFNVLVSETKAVYKQLINDYADRKINVRALALDPKLSSGG